MAQTDFLSLVSGVPTKTSPVTSSAGAGDAGKVVGLNGSGVIDSTMLPADSVAPTLTATASEAIAAGSLVNLFDSTGLKVRLADNTAASAGKWAVGYCQSAISNGASGTVTMIGKITGLTGLTVGAVYYLAAAGGITATVPTSSGYTVQRVGIATSTTELWFHPLAPYVV